MNLFAVKYPRQESQRQPWLYAPQMKTALAAVGYIVTVAINLSVLYMNSLKINL